MKKNILVLGASGFIGHNLTEKLLLYGYHVISVGRNCTVNRKQELCIAYDFYTPFETFISQFNDEYIDDIDVCYILSWNGHQKNYRTDEQINFRTSDCIYKFIVNLIAYLNSKNKSIKKLVLAGSQEEYGNAKGIVDENYFSDKSNCTAYGMGKRLLYEKLLGFSLNKEIVVFEFRLHSIYGYKRPLNQMISFVVQQCMENKDIVMQTDCNQKWDFLYIYDLVEAFLQCVHIDLYPGIYNISFGLDRSLRDFILQVKEIVGSKNEIVFCNLKENYGPDFIMNVSKFKSATGWKPTISFIKGIEIIMEQIKKHT